MGLEQLLPAIAGMTWQHLVMIGVGVLLIYLAIARKYEPTLLLPMGFGAILVNIPLSSALTQIDPTTGEAVEGVLNIFFQAGIATEIFPLLIFIAIGAMIDFSPLFRNPSLLLFGAAAQFGIFLTMLFASLLGYDLREAASIGIIAPSSLSLIGFLMFGNLVRECGVLNKLSLSAQNELASLVTLLLGITIASTMTAERFIRVDTLIIITLGLFAFPMSARVIRVSFSSWRFSTC
ncbi:MAG: sodium ion-translocating decarboxylase subunit beta [Proteiniphilum sp.]|jgi:Na+-transporting methylmalonyl-CoA/oxaloacetate decarboxylase beta subunit|nr:sodium ion-translocating decarboxylase subunit beta [Proteiniphilum sp.]MDD3332577.1 sodium ion-translocating decarboxylase subunit beta [Proteiniphilum sp.]MDD3555151.1 sodium ion-translocating decarboxylase subunit beta [Proteiniphilum sp.]MDD3979558.1 sodium ion-translocating decarboxylase subunit beta [Proteiniphilum sp.]MDD4486723.1 sodium ion-translocating decarboxylase subunit beta [Proteiniphilum sp.]